MVPTCRTCVEENGAKRSEIMGYSNAIVPDVVDFSGIAENNLIIEFYDENKKACLCIHRSP